MVLPTTVGSLLSDAVQNLYVRTAAPAAVGPSSCAFSRRPSTGRRPITSKNDPPTTPAFTMRGSPPRPIFVAIDERAEQHAADDAEDGGIGADAERERDHDGGGQPFDAQQRAHGEA